MINLQCKSLIGMKFKRAFIIIILLSSPKAFACECINSLDNSFLGNSGSFDYIVKGKILTEDFDFVTLIIEETYKGDILNDTITIGGYSLCDNLLFFKSGETIIIGLEQLDSLVNPHTYVAPGCVTSSILIKGQTAYAPEVQLPMFKKPRIELLSRSMGLKTLENKLRRKGAN